MKIELSPKVYTDLLEIMHYYEKNAGSELAENFYAEFSRYARVAGARPYSFPTYGQFRRVNLNRFPVHFLFQIINDETVRILLVRHDRRHPDFGLED